MNAMMKELETMVCRGLFRGGAPVGPIGRHRPFQIIFMYLLYYLHCL